MTLLTRRQFSVLGALALAAGLAACSAPQAAPAAAPAPPRLVVLLVVDGLPQRQLLAYRDQLAPDGLARLLDRGAWFANAHHGQAFTVTAAGHATLLTGATPDRSGVIGNDWRDPGTGEPVYCTSDPGAHYIGHPTKPLDGTSPKNLRAESLGDVLVQRQPGAKVLAVSGKDRGAILPAGQRGTPYMYMAGTGRFASTTHYMAAHPDWVEAFNVARPADRYFKTAWTPLLPEAAYARSLPDGQPWYAPGGRLPMALPDADAAAPTPAFYAALLRSPFADALTLDFARAAIAGERLGQRGVTDLLSISLSGHDYVNHAFGAESRLSHDHLLQLDRLLQAFFRDLDARLGPDAYLVVLTADHGFMPAPEDLAQRGQPSGRITLGRTLAPVNAGLRAQFGPGEWARFSASSLWLNKALLARTGADADAVAEAARRLLLAQPGIAAAHTRRELLAGAPPPGSDAALFAAMRRSWHPEVSGEVQFTIQPNWMVGTGYAATHGSPHPYDTQVPLAWYGPRWIAPGQVEGRVEVSGLAPTLAALLGLPPPSSADGRPLPLPARR